MRFFGEVRNNAGCDMEKFRKNSLNLLVSEEFPQTPTYSGL